jgi:hypothetical protein
MSKLFIFANSYAAKTILLGIDYLINIDISEILLLSENHNSNEKTSYTNGVKVRLFDDINNCIKAADYIILLQDEKLPVKSIDYVITTAKIFNKKCFHFRIPQFTPTICTANKDDCDFVNRPVVLCISIGSVSQQRFSEIILNKILSELNINFRQYFSSDTEQFILQLDNCGILNRNLSHQLHNSDDSYQIIINSISIDNLSRIKEYVNLLNACSPDYIILNTEFNYFDYNYIKMFVEFVCFSRLDILLKSRFRIVDSNFTVYCKKHIEEIVEDGIYDIEIDDIEKAIRNSLLAKLAFPEHMVKY